MPQALLDLFSHALTFVPIVGPILAAVLGGVAALWKPAQTAVAGLGSGALSLARTVIAIPGAIQVLLGLVIALLIVWIVLVSGQASTAKAALIDPATKLSWQSEAQASASGLTVARASLASATAAIARQNVSIQTLHDAGQTALAKSAGVASGLSAAAPAIAKRAAAVASADQGANVCDRVLNVDAAFSGGL